MHSQAEIQKVVTLDYFTNDYMVSWRRPGRSVRFGLVISLMTVSVFTCIIAFERTWAWIFRKISEFPRKTLFFLIKDTYIRQLNISIGILIPGLTKKKRLMWQWVGGLRYVKIWDLTALVCTNWIFNSQKLPFKCEIWIKFLRMAVAAWKPLIWLKSVL